MAKLDPVEAEHVAAGGVDDAREEMVGEIAAAAAELRKFVSGQLGRLLRHEVFASAAEGALKGGPETRERFELVVRPRIEAIVAGRDS